MLEGYFDESGIHDGAPLCLVAGLIADARKWTRFYPRWQKVLDDYSIKEFHARDFGNHAGEFHGWDDHRRSRFLARLINIINDARAFPIGLCVATDVFERLNEDERRYVTGGQYQIKQERWIRSGAPNKPYFLPFVHCLFVGVYKTQTPHTKIDFVFDAQHIYEGLALKIFADIKADPDWSNRHRMGAIIYDSKTNKLPLQAADLIAYECYQYGQRRMQGYRGVNKVLENINKGRCDVCIADEELMNNLLASFRDQRAKAANSD
jgi:hypothetical protein